MSGATTSIPGPVPLPPRFDTGRIGGPPPNIQGGLMDPGAVPPPAAPGTPGMLRVVSPGALGAMDDAAQAAREAAKRDERLEPGLEDLSAFIRRRFDMMKNHRNSAQGWTHRLIASLRMFNGEYEPEKAAAIREFGGSDVYARLVSVKCRAASALLRDIYLAKAELPWGVEPTPVPTIPDNIAESVDKLIEAEIAKANQGQGMIDPATGQPILPPSEEEVAQRRAVLETAAEDAIRKKAETEAKQAEKALDDLLVEGEFYKALAEFLADLPRFPFACIRGPIVYMVPTIKWERGPPGPPGPDGQPKQGQAKLIKKNMPRMFWRRVSPFDLWWSPGASTVEAADFIFRDRKSRGELNTMLDVPGYRQDALKLVLEEYPNGYTEPPDVADSVRAQQELREDPSFNETGMYDLLEFHGSVQGKLLIQFGMSKKDIPDEIRDYSVQLWMVGRHVIKVQLAMSPRERPPFYITSYDKVPGTMIGNSVPDMLSDIQDVCNAALRGLVNNTSMSSGPQVVINESVLGIGEDTTRIWPWRVWRTTQRPGMNNADPIKFFQPASVAQQMMVVYEKFTQIADETSAIPRYVTGSERMGGAGRTASGLAMLMGNASKMLQTVAANVDADVFEPLLQFLYDIVMLTDTTGKLRGDEKIKVRGVEVAMQRELERQRQLEFLQATANPVDMGIVGQRGRGAILRSVANTLGLDGQSIVPTDDELVAREKLAQAAAMAPPPPAPGGTPGGPGAAPGGVGVSPPGAPGAPSPAAVAQGTQTGGEETGPSAIQGPRVNLQQQAPAPS